MDIASSELKMRARAGQASAIALLIQHQLNDDAIDATAWRRSTTIHLELLSVERFDKARAIQLVRQLLRDLSPEGVDAIQASCYLYGTDHPCWIERVAVIPSQATKIGQSRRQSLSTASPALSLPAWGKGLTAALAPKPLTWVTGLLVLVVTLGWVWRPTPFTPSLATQQQQDKPRASDDVFRPVRARRRSPALGGRSQLQQKFN